MLKSRKKMLLSSIAMLLVALVALGSATFAWYYTNAQVTASSTSTHATAADGLVIRKGTTGPWQQSITYTSSADAIAPFSMDYPAFEATYDNKTGISGAKGTSVSDGGYTEGGSGKANWEAIKGAVTYDDFYIAKAATSGTKNVKMTISGSQVDGTYINVLVFVDGKLYGAVTSDSAASGTTGRKSDGTAGGSISSFDTLGAQIDRTITIQNNNGGSAATGTSGSHVEVIAYPDGENSKCTTNTANTSAFTVNFTFDAVS